MLRCLEDEVMTCNRPHHRRATSIVGLLVLAGGLWGCGSDSQTTRAPAPAPAPFRPQTVTVALGENGGQVTLVSTQAGGWQLNGQAFTSGSTAKGQNGLNYRLSLSGSTWTAEFVPPSRTSVVLGTSGQTVVVERREDGAYFGDGEPLVSGTVRSIAGGRQYRFVLDADGMWTATFVPPPPQAVPLGTSGEAVLIHMLENRTYSLDGTPLIAGRTHTTANGLTYRFQLTDDGWEAVFVVGTATVALGRLGGTVVIRETQPGMFTIGSDTLQSGDAIQSPTTGGTYRLTRGVAGWVAEFIPRAVSVAVPYGGSDIVLVQYEDGGYRLGEATVLDGSEIEHAGNVYALALSGNTWTAKLVSGSLTVPLGSRGDSVELVLRSNGRYFFGNVEVRSGRTITSPSTGARYTLTLREGVWTASTYFPTIPVGGGGGGGSPISSSESLGNGLVEQMVGVINDGGLSSLNDVSGVDYDTYRSGTVQTFADEAFALFDSVLGDVARLSVGTDAEKRVARLVVNAQWGPLNQALSRVFLPTAPTTSILGAGPPMRGGDVDLEDVVEDLTTFRNALQSPSDFESAFGEDGELFSDLSLTVRTALDIGQIRTADLFDSNLMAFRTTENTRFGLVAMVLDPSGSVGLSAKPFAYSPLSNAASGTGTATYIGHTWAFDPNDGNLFGADIELLLKFGAGSSGSDILETTIDNIDPVASSEAWRYGGKVVDSIEFGNVESANIAREWMVNGGTATLKDSAGTSLNASGDSVSLNYRGKAVRSLTGSDNAALGQWELNDGSDSLLLQGAFGAELSP